MGQYISLIDSVIDVTQWLVIAYYTLTDSVMCILQLHSVNFFKNVVIYYMTEC